MQSSSYFLKIAYDHKGKMRRPELARRRDIPAALTYTIEPAGTAAAVLPARAQASS